MMQDLRGAEELETQVAQLKDEIAADEKRLVELREELAAIPPDMG